MLSLKISFGKRYVCSLSLFVSALIAMFGGSAVPFILWIIDLILAIMSRFEADSVDFFDFGLIYGVSGVAIVCFASGNIWRLEVQILGRLSDEEAMEFRKSVENESTMVSIAVSIPTRKPSRVQLD